MSNLGNPISSSFKKRISANANEDAVATSASEMSGNNTSPANNERSTWAERAGKAANPANEYKAFESVRADSRPVLELRLKDGLSYGVNYAYVRGFRCAMNGKTHSLTLFSDIGHILIKGRHLQDLKEKLFAHAVLWVRLFDTEKDQLPGDGEPLVLDLVISAAEDAE